MSLFNFTTGFLAGVYAGVFLAQNYKVPVASDPATIVEKMGAWLDTFKNDKGRKDD